MKSGLPPWHAACHRGNDPEEGPEMCAARPPHSACCSGRSAPSGRAVGSRSEESFATSARLRFFPVEALPRVGRLGAGPSRMRTDRGDVGGGLGRGFRRLGGPPFEPPVRVIPRPVSMSLTSPRRYPESSGSPVVRYRTQGQTTLAPRLHVQGPCVARSFHRCSQAGPVE